MLFCGADPTLRSAAGELPVELVPVCGTVGAVGADGTMVRRQCRCMSLQDQEVGVEGEVWGR